MSRAAKRLPLLRLAVLLVALALSGALPAVPAVAELGWLRDELSAGLWFDRDTYQAGDTVRLTVVLTNRTEHPITGIVASCGGGMGEKGTLSSSGPEWGDLGGPNGRGVTVPPGGPRGATTTRSFVVSAPMPDESPDLGQVGVSCSFSATGHSMEPFPLEAGTSARVSGVLGGGRGRIFQDRDGDSWFDDGEGIDGAIVVLTDRDNGATVARPATGAGGEFAVDGLPAGWYGLRVDGLWKPRLGSSWYYFHVAAGDLVGDQNLAVVPGTERENQLPNLKATAAFDNPAYHSGDDVRVRITLRNIGNGAAEGVWADACLNPPTALGGIVCDGATLGDLDQLRPGTPGIRIGPGEVWQTEIAGMVWDALAGVVTFQIGFAANVGDLKQELVRVAVMAPMTATRGSYSGVVYEDRNNNGKLDPGEELDRVRVHLSGGVPPSDFTEIADAHGRFEFPDIPTGHYNIVIDLPGGLEQPNLSIVVDELDDGEQIIRLGRSPLQVLEPSIRFTRDSYRMGDTAHLTITLTNRGVVPLVGIKAFCGHLGDPNELNSLGPGWGDLGRFATGVTVGAGETRSFDVWATVPEAARAWGYIWVHCWFGLGPEAAEDRDPSARAEARVPGAIGSSGGRVFYDRDHNGFTEGEGIPATTVVLLDELTGEVVATTMTDAGGHYLFRDMPAYHYEFRIMGPWQLANPGDKFFHVFGDGDQPDRYDVSVIPSPDPDDPTEPLPQAGVGPPATTFTSVLAATGADVLDVLILSATAFVLGLVSLLLRRRRC